MRIAWRSSGLFALSSIPPAAPISDHSRTPVKLGHDRAVIGLVGDIGVLRRHPFQILDGPALRLPHLAFQHQRRRLRRCRTREQRQRDECGAQAAEHRHSRYLATITSEALMTAIASSPAANLKSSTASLVIEEVMTTPLPMSIRTCAVVAPL